MEGTRIGSLCSGYGGLDLAALELFGGRVAWHCETDPGAARILAEHWPGVPNLGSIIACYPRWVALATALDALAGVPASPDRERERGLLLAAAGDLTGEHDDDACAWGSAEDVDVLTAGFPCQPWSLAGRRGGVADPRDLWPAVAHAVRVVRPRLVMLENVAGFAGKRLGIGRTADDLAAIGYGLRWTRVRAADAGAPHLRERWFGLAWDAAAAGDARRLEHGNDGAAADPDVVGQPGRPEGGSGAADQPGAGLLPAPA